MILYNREINNNLRDLEANAHSSVKYNTVTNVGKKLHREFYSLFFCAVCCLVDSEFV